MPDITDLGLPPEPVGEIDYNAPEPGSFPPQIKPGRYTFVFHLGPMEGAPASDAFSTVEVEDPPGFRRKYLQVNHHATLTVQETDLQTHEVVTRDVTLAYQRANFYKHAKMANSSAGDLIRSMGEKLTGDLTPQAVANFFREMDGRRSYPAEVIWRAYCQTCDVTTSTAPRKKKGELPWPKDKQTGELLEMAECPQCHQKQYARPEISRYKLPEAAQGQTA